jgi:hypothetical protein
MLSLVVVDAADEDAHPDLGPTGGQALQVGQDRGIGYPGPFPVPGVIHDLEIEKDEVGLRGQTLEGAVLRGPGGIDGRPQAALPAAVEKGFGEGRLDGWIAARE